MGDLGLSPGVGKIPWRRERLPTSVFWPGEFHGLYSPRGPRGLDTTERLSFSTEQGDEIQGEGVTGTKLEPQLSYLLVKGSRES